MGLSFRIFQGVLEKIYEILSFKFIGEVTAIDLVLLRGFNKYNMVFS